MEEENGKLNLIAIKNFPADNNFIYIVDFLNKSLRDKNLMFGLTKDKENNEMIIKIYEV